MNSHAWTVAASGAGLLEIGASLFYLTVATSTGHVHTCMLVHGTAATACALFTAAGSKTNDSSASQSRAALSVFFVMLAFLLPIGGVLTVLAVGVILRSETEEPQWDEEELFSSIQRRAASKRSMPILEPLAGMLRSADLETCRAMASGLRSAGASQPEHAARLLHRLKQDPDTETRFRAQGAVARAVRDVEARLKDDDRAAACMELARWSHATGACRETLLGNAVELLEKASADHSPDTFSLHLLTRALLAQRMTAKAETALGRLRDAGASREMLAPLEAELLFQQGKWKALTAHCGSMRTSNPELLANVRFWASATKTA